MNQEKAFPQGVDQGATAAGFPVVEHTGGMDLRDYFAAKALDALIGIGPGSHNMESFQLEMAGWAYGYANAMLEARKAVKP